MTDRITSPTRPRWLRLGALISALSLTLVPLSALPASAAGEGSVTGVVTYNGLPADGMTVNLYPFTGTPTSTDTNSSGEYTFDNIDLGDYSLSIFEQAENPGGHPGVSSGTITLTAPAPDAVVGFTVEPWVTGTGSISGTVTDSVSGDPILNAFYYFGGNSQAASVNGFVDSFGGYRIGDLPAGDFSLTVGAPGYVSADLTPSVDEGQAVALNIALVARNATITGQVRDIVGNLIADEFVSISSGGPMGYSSALTDPLGNYSKGELGAGSYTVSVGGRGTNWQLSEQTITAIADSTVTANFVLTPRVTASISGSIVDGSANSLQGICTTVYNTAGVGVGGALASDRRGNYTVSDLEAGDYVLLFWDCNYSRLPAFAFTYFGGASNFAAATPITVSPGVDEFGKNVSLVLGGTISGTIDLAAPGGTVGLPSYGGMDATTYQLVGSTWVVFPDESPFVGSGDYGVYTVPGLPDGTYRIGFIDRRTEPRAYTPQYWNSSATFAGATHIVISGGTVVTGIDATMSIPRPGDAPASVATDELAPSEEGEISSTPAATQGETIEVQVDPALAGEWVSVWGHSTPVLLGNWVQVSSAGRVSVPISSALPAGSHQLVAQNADGDVIGWTPIQIAAARSSSGMADTGLPITNLIAPLSGALLLLAAGIVLLTRRRRA